MIGKLKLLFLLGCLVPLSFASSYDRKDFNYRSYKPDIDVGFYTGKTCDFTIKTTFTTLASTFTTLASTFTTLASTFTTIKTTFTTIELYFSL